jgi:hypothetical protein
MEDSNDTLYEIEPVYWFRRGIGYLIDRLAIFFILYYLAYQSISDEILAILFYIGYFIYSYVFELLTSRTLGKILTGTIVLNKNYNLDIRPTGFQVFLRTISKLIPFDGLSAIINNSYPWHDLISKTTLISKKDYDNLELSMDSLNSSDEIE